MLQRGLASLALIATLSTTAVADAMTIGSVRIDFADPAQRPNTKAERDFVAAYLDAARRKDLTAMRKLVHPKSLACASSDTNTRHLNFALSRPFRQAIPDDARIAMAQLPELELHVPKTDVMTLPVMPNAIVVIDYKWLQKDEQGKVTRDIGMTIVRLLAPDGDALKLAEYCLMPSGEALFEAKERGKASTTR